jgi:hypothetical protein
MTILFAFGRQSRQKRIDGWPALVNSERKADSSLRSE